LGGAIITSVSDDDLVVDLALELGVLIFLSVVTGGRDGRREDHTEEDGESLDVNYMGLTE